MFVKKIKHMNLKEFIKKKKSLKKLAGELGIPQVTMSWTIANAHKMSVERLNRIAEAMNVTPEYLLKKINNSK